jgi:phosphoribosylformylglycinamidine synthase subunit PurQ / glutaminase
MAKPKALILRTAGTNCDLESAHACERAGFDAERVHVNRVGSGEVSLDDYQFLFIAGGFSYGDDVAAGRIMALELTERFGDALLRFEDAGKPVLGVCNGFQVLIKTGLLPFHTDAANLRATLTVNDSARFEARWVHMNVEPESVCIFTKGLRPRIELPVANGEGKFVVRSATDLEELERDGQIVMRYTNIDGSEPVYPADPNGSLGHIAGVCNKRGTIFGLMPHPERSLDKTNHPRWTRETLPDESDGMAMFRNVYEYCRKN